MNQSKKRKQRIMTAVIFAGIILAAVIIMVVESRKDPGRLVQVVQDGKVLYTFDLDKANDQEVTVLCDEGYNVVTIKEHKIFVSEADCPDQVCVSMGELRMDSLPIICMPHGLVIEFVEK